MMAQRPTRRPPPLHQSEESRARPMSTRDFVGDLRQRAVASSLELEGVVENQDGMLSAMPFPDEARAGFETRLRRLRHWFAAFVGDAGAGRRPDERPLAHPRQTAEFEFLKA
jgi:hypothetical protein